MRYDELTGKIEENEEKKWLIVDDYMLNKILGKIKDLISTEKSVDTKILIDTFNKLPDDITLKKVVVLMTCVINDGNKFYEQLFLEHALYVK